jgi:hypothetical protein
MNSYKILSNIPTITAAAQIQLGLTWSCEAGIRFEG